MHSSVTSPTLGHSRPLIPFHIKIIPLKGYDVILGMDWIEDHSPMNILWAEKWLQFPHHHQLITLQGILPTPSLGTPVSQHQLHQLYVLDYSSIQY